ncbi:hypothetical protein DXA50_20345 [Butyricimonas virosa]|jgi:hypothetical protein|uniref:DUF2019 domain-containing protein n=1 Tax=Butyricimonas virosa TaxID=544645 RepID=A0A413IHA5_9BACT|nr:hypothetical protein [Butyricimonas virosa]MDY6217784.1 hypothetical protein [Butyricimonas virosa]RGL79865.1 hypothetical protein DXC42_20170 [Butyricimonas virosa]RGY10409.1 hypothetical protein DXA50_20345 [Butyricimonas virosa]RHI13564.1 hypothetical protein DW174_20320 [Butyricimonas virosa]
MRKIKNVEDALILFESNVDIIHECSKSGNYRKGNRAYDHVETIVKYLLENNAIESLKTFYESSDLYLRLSAAVYLAPLDSENCYKIIKEIMDADEGWASFDAKYTLKEWSKLSDPKVYDRILAK